MLDSANKFWLTLAILLSAAACAGQGTSAVRESAGAPDNSAAGPQEAMLAACAETANRYPYVRDRLLYREYGDLMTSDAVFQIEGRPRVVGRDAIVEALRQRGPGMETRHVSKLVDIRSSGPGTATGLSYVTIWRADAVAYAEGNKSVSGPWLIGEYHDQYRMEDGKCKISERIVKIIFHTTD